MINGNFSVICLLKRLTTLEIANRLGPLTFNAPFVLLPLAPNLDVQSMTSNNKNSTDQNKRIDQRTPMKVQVKICHPSIGEVVVQTRDISDGGIFLLTENIDVPPIGTIVEGQVQGIDMEGPILKLEIVRMEPAGIGLKFINK